MVEVLIGLLCVFSILMFGLSLSFINKSQLSLTKEKEQLSKSLERIVSEAFLAMRGSNAGDIVNALAKKDQAQAINEQLKWSLQQDRAAIEKREESQSLLDEQQALDPDGPIVTPDQLDESHLKYDQLVIRDPVTGSMRRIKKIG